MITKKCRDCGVCREGTRAKDVLYERVRYIFTDTTGQQWYGDRCFPCNVAAVRLRNKNSVDKRRERQRRYRARNRAANLADNIQYKHSKKTYSCGNCKIATVNRYYCSECHRTVFSYLTGGLDDTNEVTY